MEHVLKHLPRDSLLAVYVYGSHLSGTQTASSDQDLCAIVDDYEDDEFRYFNPAERYHHTTKLISDKDGNVDIAVYSRSRFQELCQAHYSMLVEMLLADEAKFCLYKREGFAPREYFLSVVNKERFTQMFLNELKYSRHKIWQFETREVKRATGEIIDASYTLKKLINYYRYYHCLGSFMYTGEAKYTSDVIDTIMRLKALTRHEDKVSAIYELRNKYLYVPGQRLVELARIDKALKKIMSHMPKKVHDGDARKGELLQRVQENVAKLRKKREELQESDNGEAKELLSERQIDTEISRLVDESLAHLLVINRRRLKNGAKLFDMYNQKVLQRIKNNEISFVGVRFGDIARHSDKIYITTERQPSELVFSVIYRSENVIKDLHELPLCRGDVFRRAKEDDDAIVECISPRMLHFETIQFETLNMLNDTQNRYTLVDKIDGQLIAITMKKFDQVEFDSLLAFSPTMVFRHTAEYMFIVGSKNLYIITHVDYARNVHIVVEHFFKGSFQSFLQVLVDEFASLVHQGGVACVMFEMRNRDYAYPYLQWDYAEHQMYLLAYSRVDSRGHKRIVYAHQMPTTSLARPRTRENLSLEEIKDIYLAEKDGGKEGFIVFDESHGMKLKYKRRQYEL